MVVGQNSQVPCLAERAFRITSLRAAIFSSSAFASSLSLLLGYLAVLGCLLKNQLPKLEPWYIFTTLFS